MTCAHRSGRTFESATCLLSGCHCTIERRLPTECGKDFAGWVDHNSRSWDDAPKPPGLIARLILTLPLFVQMKLLIDRHEHTIAKFETALQSASQTLTSNAIDNARLRETLAYIAGGGIGEMAEATRVAEEALTGK